MKRFGCEWPDSGGTPGNVVMLTPPTATPETVTVGDNTTLTLGTYSNATSVVGVLMQGGIDRTGEIVDGVWSPGVEGAATWTVTASGAGGPIVTVVDITVEAIAPIDYSTIYAYGDQSTPGIGPDTALTGAENDGAAGWDWSVAGTGAEVQKDADGLMFNVGKRLTAASLTPDTTGGAFVVVDFTAESQGGANAIIIECAPSTYAALRISGGNVQCGYHTGTAASWVTIGPATFGQRQVAGVEIDDDAKTVRYYLSGGEVTTISGRTFNDRTFATLNMGVNFDGIVHRYAIATRVEGQPWSHDFVTVIEDFTEAP